MQWDKIHIIEAFHDCPRSGFADFKSRPHFYDRQFDEAADDFADTWMLVEVDQRTLDAAFARHEIWLRWQSAFDQGLTGIETHPALLPDRARYTELDKEISAQIAANGGTALIKRGVFRYPGNWAEVCWRAS